MFIKIDQQAVKWQPTRRMKISAIYTRQILDVYLSTCISKKNSPKIYTEQVQTSKKKITQWTDAYQGTSLRSQLLRRLSQKDHLNLGV